MLQLWSGASAVLHSHEAELPCSGETPPANVAGPAGEIHSWMKIKIHSTKKEGILRYTEEYPVPIPVMGLFFLQISVF